MRRLVLAVSAIALAGCQKTMSTDVVKQYENRTLYTCCNIYYEKESASDANYHVGQVVPYGSPVQVQGGRGDSVSFIAGGTKLKLDHEYGGKVESQQQYLDKIFVAEDPKAKVARLPKDVQSAINDGRVEVGMTKEQVLMAIGYPPAHRTSTSSNDWTYWMNRWITYRVQFDDSGKVSGIVGTNAPTRNQPIKPDKAPPVVKEKGPAKKKKK